MPRRELNKLNTWQAIHSTAIELVQRDGLGAVTIDAIAERAEISRRTFFNYFATKEDAVLGMRAARVSDADFAAFVASTDDVFGGAVRLMTSVIRTVFHDSLSVTTRRELLRAYPELRVRLDDHVRSAEALVQAVLVERSGAATGSATEATEATEPADTRALVLLAGAVMRFAFTPNDDGSINDDPASIDAAIARFRQHLTSIL
jgi:AcrR family transcriptional regulator